MQRPHNTKALVYLSDRSGIEVGDKRLGKKNER